MSNTKKAKPKRLLSLFLALVMVLGMFPAMSITASAYSGTGTEENPYVVTTYDELKSLMATAPINGSTRYIKLGADVSNEKNEDGIGLLLTYGQCVDLDLNGYDISRIGISNDNIFSATNGAKLTIRDSVGDGTVTSKLAGDRMTAVLYCYRNGEIIVEGGTFKSEYGTAVLVEGYVTINGGTFIANQKHTIIVNDTDYGLLSMNGGHVSNNGYGNYSIFITVDCIAKLCTLTADAKIYSYSSTNLHNFIPESSALTKGYFRYDYEILPDEETGLIEIVKSGTMFIDAASVTVTAPLSGQAPDLDINNITVGGSIYIVDQITWYNGGTVDNPGVKMTSSDTFEAGQTYIVDVHVKPTGGYVIQNGCTVTINGVSTDKVFYRDGVNGASNYRVALTARPTVNITGMGADVTGFELLNGYFDVEATPLDSTKYTIRDITWSDCHLTDDSPVITDSSMFEAGETWQLKLWFKPAADYSISNPDTLPVTIAGQTATYVGTDGDYYGYKIEKTFSKYLHDYIDLSMDAPTSGMTPAEYAETIKIKNNDRFPYNNFEIGEVQCYRTDWNDFSTFAAGKTYFITIEIDLKDDTSFEFAHHDSDITALVNGTPVEDYVVVDSDSTWESNFYTYDGVQLNYQVYFTAKGEPTGVTVSGTATSKGSSTDDVTIQLIESGMTEVSYETIVQGNNTKYSIDGVLAGVYTMRVMKKGHITSEYTITVGTEDVTQDVCMELISEKLMAELSVNGSKEAINLTVGGNVTLVPTVTGGKSPYTYQYLMKNVSTGKTMTLKDYSSATSYTGALTSVGTKIFTVNVKDSEGTVVTTNSVTVNVSQGTSALTGILKVNGSTSQISLTKGSSVTLEPKATGGTAPYTYKYMMKTSATGTNMVLKDYSSATSYTGPLTSVGTKIFTVNVRDSKGTVVATNSVTVVVAADASALACSLKVNDETGTINLSKGGSVKLVPTATGGTAPYTYQYMMKNVSTGKTITLKNYSSATSYTGPITSYGTKIFTVNVKDGTGKVVTSNEVTVVTEDASALACSLKVNGSTETINLAKGGSVTLVPTATGGTAPYTYQYVMKNVSTGKTMTLKNYSSATSYTGPLTSVGTKIFTVNVKDSKGTVVASNSVTVVVTDASFKAELKVNESTGTLNLEKGGSVILVPTVTGGTSPYTYQYLMKTSATGTNMVLKDYSSTTSYTGPLTSTGTKIFTVNVKDSKGTVVATNSVTVVVK